jgi:predicted nuclease with TOPRIM domain
MPDLKEILQRIRDKKKEKKKLNESYRDALANSKTYQDLLEQLKALKTRKAQFERNMQAEFTQELTKNDRLKEDLKNEAQLLSDVALTKFMKGENIEIVDENDVKYEPIFKVSFKKSA